MKKVVQYMIENVVRPDKNIEDHFHSWLPFGWNVWSSYYYDGFGWIRFFGKGLKWKNTHTHMLLFSERHGLSKTITIGKWRVGII